MKKFRIFLSLIFVCLLFGNGQTQTLNVGDLTDVIWRFDEMYVDKLKVGEEYGVYSSFMKFNSNGSIEYGIVFNEDTSTVQNSLPVIEVNNWELYENHITITDPNTSEVIQEFDILYLDSNHLICTFQGIKSNEEQESGEETILVELRLKVN